MLYEQSLEIERRLDTALQLIRAGRYSTPKLAEKLNVSIPTVSRCVLALRQRGYDIRSEKSSAGWRYLLQARHAKGHKPKAADQRKKPA